MRPAPAWLTVFAPAPDLAAQVMVHVAQAWGWRAVAVQRLLAVSLFGNLLLVDEEDIVWRLCPEELSLAPLAYTADGSWDVLHTGEFRADWALAALAAQAHEALGPPAPGRVWCLKTPAVLGGAYGPDNLATLDLHELITVSGALARQIAEPPEGTPVPARVVE